MEHDKVTAVCNQCGASASDVVLILWKDGTACMVCLREHHPRSWSQLVEYVEMSQAFGVTEGKTRTWHSDEPRR